MDISQHTISRANLDGSDVEVLVDSGTLGPYYMELDLAAGRLYWTDYATSEIRRANLDGSDQMVLIDTYPGWPVGIALDLFHGKVYWTLLGGAIQRANLDGSDIEDVITDLPVAWAVELDPRCGTCAGDVNGDNKVDAADIQKFVECLTASASTCACADVDGVPGLDSGDVDVFVQVLLDGAPCP